MHWFSVGVAVAAAAAIIGLGVMYLLVPSTIMRSFGLPLPDDDANVASWLRLKGSRDIASGLVVFAMVAWGEPRLLGIVLAILALIPFGDMAVVLAARGSTRTALGVHGLTATLMILAAVPLITGVT